MAPPPRSLRHPLVRALLALTFSTGLVDAACYLGLGRVFAANMTGNVVLLGFGIAGKGGLRVLGPIVSLLAFLVGAGAGGVLTSRLGERRVEHLRAALALEALVLAVATVLALAAGLRAGDAGGYVAIGLLALAMGLRNATVRRLGVPDLSTTVLTMTLTGFASEAPPLGGTGRGTARRASAIVTMLAGAVAGALLLKADLTLPLAAAVLAAVVAWLLYRPAIAADKVAT
jgi:uncharacterized membrane protein YoaK (UPF0700 family)